MKPTKGRIATELKVDFTRMKLGEFVEDLRELDRLLERLTECLREETQDLARERANDLARGRSGGAGGEGDGDR